MVYGLVFSGFFSDLSDLSLDEAVFEAEEVEDSVEADG